MAENKKYPCAFQRWRNGEYQKSATYWSGLHTYSSEVDDFTYFCDQHSKYAEQGNSVASLVICNNDAEFRHEMDYFD